MLARLLSGFSGNGNSLNAAAFLSPTLHYYVARTVSLKNPFGVPINFSPVVTAFMNSDPSVSCFNSVDVDTTFAISNEAFTWGTLIDSFPFITGYQIANHGGASLATLTSTSVIVSSWCLPDPTITLPTTGPYYYDVYDPT